MIPASHEPYTATHLIPSKATPKVSVKRLDKDRPGWTTIDSANMPNRSTGQSTPFLEARKGSFGRLTLSIQALTIQQHRNPYSNADEYQ